MRQLASIAISTGKLCSLGALRWVVVAMVWVSGSACGLAQEYAVTPDVYGPDVYGIEYGSSPLRVLAGPTGGYEFLPLGTLYPAYLAGPKESRLGSQVFQ